MVEEFWKDMSLYEVEFTIKGSKNKRFISGTLDDTVETITNYFNLFMENREIAEVEVHEISRYGWIKK